MNSLREGFEQQQLLNAYAEDPDYQRYLQQLNDEKSAKLDSLTYTDSLKNRFMVLTFSNNVFDLSDKNPTSPPSDYKLGR